jgi:hypothetical protein
MRQAALVLTTMALALLLASGVALAVNKTGTDGPNILMGTNESDKLLGRGGKDILLGEGGKDILRGEAGNDVAQGARGADEIFGARGNDLLIDGPLTESSEDNLSGGRGKDVLDAFNRPAFEDTIECGKGFDRVLADSKDVVADDCERVAVGFKAVEQLVGSIIQSGFLEGLNPRFDEFV